MGSERGKPDERALIGGLDGLNDRTAKGSDWLAELISATPPEAFVPVAKPAAPAGERPFGAEDHRERMRERFARFGDEMDDYELLEMALYRALPRRDTRPIAKALLKAFGSLAGVFNAPAGRLSEIDGIGPAAAHELRLVGALLRACSREDIHAEGDLLGSWDKVLAHCRKTLAHEREEQFRVLFLNKRNGLIADEVMQRGTVDHTPVYPREIVKRALELSASALILVHNHPSGDPTPSPADIEMTRRVADVTRSMDIVVHDHLVIGRNGYVSLKAEGLF